MQKIIFLSAIAFFLLTCSDNEPGADTLPEPVVLNQISLQDRELSLSWTRSTMSNFGSYSIMRSENDGVTYEEIATIADVNQTSFTDTEIQFGVTYLYKIGTTLLSSTQSLMSNIEPGTFNSAPIGGGIEMLKIDPIHPYIYALNPNLGSVLIINKQTSEIESTIFVGSAPTDMDISLDNSKLYTIHPNSVKVAIVDLDTQQKINELTLDFPALRDLVNPDRIVTVGSDKIAVTEFGTDRSEVALIDANSGEITLPRFRLPFYKPDLITSTDKMSVLVTETHTTGSVAYRFNLETDGSLSQTSVDHTDGLDWWHPGYGTILTPISGDGKYIFYCGKKITYNELTNQVGGIEDKIYASNHDGSIAVGAENIWDAVNFSIIGTLPPSTNTGVLVFDGINVLYTYTENSKLYYLNVE